MDWILCKNRTPSKEGKYLVYTKDGSYAIAKYTNKYIDVELRNKVWVVDWYWDFFPDTNRDVVAWMPLTKPEVK